MIGIKLEKNKKISITDNIIEMSQPKVAYIPLINRNDKNVTILVKKGEYVCKGQMIGKTKGKLSIPLFSSVSGAVMDFVEKVSSNGSKVKCVAIENDYKDRLEDSKNINSNITSYTRKEFIDIIHKCGIVGMGGKGFPTYAKYQDKDIIQTLIVNAVECEPYVTSDYMLIKTKIEEILECCDAIMEIFSINECFIAIKVGNDELKEIIKSFIGTYPKIQIIEVPDLYPMGWEKSLVRYIKHIDYKNLPTEKSIIVNNPSTIYAIYEALKYNNPLIERVVTFSGKMCKHPQNVKVRIGTSAKEVINNIIKTEKEDYILVAGGPMMGNATPTDDIIIGADTTCILALEDNKNSNHAECIRCGKCVRICPVKMSPVLIKDYINKPNQLKKLNVHKCIECGLCSYICPSKINVREFIRTAKEKTRKED